MEYLGHRCQVKVRTIFVCLCVCVCACVFILCVCACAHMFVFAFVYVCVHVHMCVRMSMKHVFSSHQAKSMFPTYLYHFSSLELGSAMVRLYCPTQA